MKGYSIGEKIVLEGVIVGSRFARGGYEYSIQTKNERAVFFLSENIARGAEVIVTGVVTSLLPLQLAVSSVVEGSGIYQSVQEAVEEKCNLNSLMLENPVTKALSEKMIAVAKRLYSARELGRFVLLRFHNDADGIAGALALSDFLSFKALQQNGAVYSQRDVISDLSLFYHERHPLVILLDFGSNEKSAKQLELLRASGTEIIVIDHHPLSKECASIPHFFLSPWLVDGIENPSSYTAGYLASEIANLLGVDGKRYARIACAGDKSSIIEISEDDKNAALVLDYVASHAAYGNNLSFYKNILNKSDLFLSIYNQARERIEETADRAMLKIKKIEKPNAAIYVLPLEGLVSKGEFPTSSKITTAILDRLKGEKPTIVIGYRRGVIILRADKRALESGINFSAITEKLALRFADFVRSAGGHAAAAAIHTLEGYENSVVDALIELL